MHRREAGPGSQSMSLVTLNHNGKCSWHLFNLDFTSLFTPQDFHVMNNFCDSNQHKANVVYMGMFIKFCVITHTVVEWTTQVSLKVLLTARGL